MKNASLHSRQSFISQELHQFESFFALLIAPYQPLPHWVYLTVYETRDIEAKVEALVGDDFATLTAGLIPDARSFVQSAIYSSFAPIDPRSEESQAQWNLTLDNAYWLIQLMAGRYLRGKDTYNGYKHGLRVISGPAPSTLTVRSEMEGASVGGNTIAIRNSLIELQKERMDTRRWRFHYAVREFNPEANFFFLTVMHQMLLSMRDTRLAVLQGNTQVERLSQFRNVDRNRAQALSITDRTGWTFAL